MSIGKVKIEKDVVNNKWIVNDFKGKLYTCDSVDEALKYAKESLKDAPTSEKK